LFEYVFSSPIIVHSHLSLVWSSIYGIIVWVVILIDRSLSLGNDGLRNLEWHNAGFYSSVVALPWSGDNDSDTGARAPCIAVHLIGVHSTLQLFMNTHTFLALPSDESILIRSIDIDDQMASYRSSMAIVAARQRRIADDRYNEMISRLALHQMPPVTIDKEEKRTAGTRAASASPSAPIDESQSGGRGQKRRGDDNDNTVTSTTSSMMGGIDKRRRVTPSPPPTSSTVTVGAGVDADDDRRRSARTRPVVATTTARK
jgi:hypothetical protein